MINQNCNYYNFDNYFSNIYFYITHESFSNQCSNIDIANVEKNFYWSKMLSIRLNVLIKKIFFYNVRKKNLRKM